MKALVFCECQDNLFRGRLGKYYATLLDGHYRRFFRHNVAPTIRKYKKDFPVRVISIGNKSHSLLEEEDIPFEKLPDADNKVKERSKRGVVRFCRSIAPANRLLMDKMLFLSTNLWEIDERYVMNSLLPVAEKIHLLTPIIEAENPSRIILFNSFSDTGKIIRGIAQKKGIQVDDHSSFLSESAHHYRNVFRSEKRPNVLGHLRRGVYQSQPSAIYQVVFAVSSGKWAHSTKQIARNLQNVLVLGTSDALKPHYNGLPFLSLGNFHTEKPSRRIDFWRVYESHYNELRHNPYFRSTFTYDGVQLWKVFARILCNVLAVSSEMILSYYYLTQEFIAVQRPKIIVLFDSTSRFSKTVIEIANQYKIPTLAIQPEMVFDRPYDSPTKATKIAVAGRQALDYYISKGNPKSKCVVAGSPLYDYVVNRPCNPKAIRVKYGVGSKKLISLDSLQPGVAELLQQSLKRLREYSTIRVPHENERLDILSVSDIVITENPIDGLLLKKRVIVPSENRIDALADAGVMFSKPSAIPSIIRSIRKSQRLKRNAALKYLCHVDGKSSRRVARLIQRMVANE